MDEVEESYEAGIWFGSSKGAERRMQRVERECERDSFLPFIHPLTPSILPFPLTNLPEKRKGGEPPKN